MHDLVLAWMPCALYGSLQRAKCGQHALITRSLLCTLRQPGRKIKRSLSEALNAVRRSGATARLLHAASADPCSQQQAAGTFVAGPSKPSRGPSGRGIAGSRRQLLIGCQIGRKRCAQGLHSHLALRRGSNFVHALHLHSRSARGPREAGGPAMLVRQGLPGPT